MKTKNWSVSVQSVFPYGDVFCLPPNKNGRRTELIRKGPTAIYPKGGFTTVRVAGARKAIRAGALKILRTHVPGTKIMSCKAQPIACPDPQHQYLTSIGYKYSDGSIGYYSLLVRLQAF